VHLFDTLSAISSGKVRDFCCLETGDPILSLSHFRNLHHDCCLPSSSIIDRKQFLVPVDLFLNCNMNMVVFYYKWLLLPLWPLYRTTGISRHPQLGTGGLCWSEVTTCMPLLMVTDTFRLWRRC